MSLIALGDRVQLKDERTGRVAFIGPIPNKADTQFGIILDNKFNGDTNGTIDNISYFETTNNKGVFIEKAQITKSKCMPCIQ